uniref:F-box only protein 39 n=1 Tax=Lygus hesperus TaxID=30085 RepID=A0A0A9YMW7_LYGHE
MQPLPYGLPWSVYPKEYLRKGHYPNIYRDEARGRLKDVVYANDDYFHKKSSKAPVRKYHQLMGGLPKRLALPWNYPPKTDEEEVLERIMACEVNEPLYKPDFPLSDKRCHIRLFSGRRSAYLPSLMPIITMPSDAGNLVTLTHNSFTNPDYAFLKDTQQGLTMWFNGKSTEKTQVASIFVNPCLVNIRFFTSEERDTTIRHLAKTIKNQKNLEKFTFENAFLNLTDAVRIVAAAALGAGNTLEKVYLANLFSPHVLPIETDSEFFDVYNELEYDSENAPEYSDETKSRFWKNILERPCFHELTLTAADKCFQIALGSFTNLTTLMINYNWVSKGNGLYLLRLESIRNGKLRKLVLLLTPSEHPNNSRQIICYKAWEEALKLCPGLELHFILSQNVAHNDFNKLFVRNMPLVSIHISSIYQIGEVNKPKTWFFSYSCRFLWSYFSQTLRMVRLEVWQPTTKVDVSMADFILKCPFLQVFVYRGHMDKLDTIHTICEFLIVNKSIRLRTIGFYVADDACRPAGWSEALDNAKRKYQTPLALKGIYLHLGVWKF